jgi:hypothetical protein
LVLLGDWASGVPRALKVAKQIEKHLNDPGAANRDRHVIHLGDAYYAGRGFEYESRLGSPWPVNELFARQIGSWCLNGNHDMFTGGRNLFNFLQQDSRFRRQNGCSYFALENDDWLIFGLDTAYSFVGLKGDVGALTQQQTDFVRQHIDRAPDKRDPFARAAARSELAAQHPRQGRSRQDDVRSLGHRAALHPGSLGHAHAGCAHRPRLRVPFARGPTAVANAAVGRRPTKIAATGGAVFEPRGTGRSGAVQPSAQSRAIGACRRRAVLQTGKQLEDGLLDKFCAGLGDAPAVLIFDTVEDHCSRATQCNGHSQLAQRDLRQTPNWDDSQKP